MNRSGDTIGVVLMVIYALGDIGTFVYLMIHDWPAIHGVLGFVLVTAINAFLAQIWPIYWALIHWVF